MIKTRLIADMYRQAVHAARYFLVSLHQELTARKHHSWGPASMQAQASNTLGIMYCGYMFVATSLHQFFCTAPCCTAPSVSTVQSAWTLTSRGSSRSQKAYHHHDSHDALCRHRRLRRQCRHSLQRSTIMCSLTSRMQKALCRPSPIHLGLQKVQ